jgi:hypothetical protein
MTSTLPFSILAIEMFAAILYLVILIRNLIFKASISSSLAASKLLWYIMVSVELYHLPIAFFESCRKFIDSSF